MDSFSAEDRWENEGYFEDGGPSTESRKVWWKASWSAAIGESLLAIGKTRVFFFSLSA